MPPIRDDLGLEVPTPGNVRRVVSIVPSLTEAIAATAPGLLVGATNWCAHPKDLDVARVRGTKNPDVERIVELRPDLVLANFEENREADLDRLRAAAVPVWVTVVRTLDEAFTSLGRMFRACALAEPPWLGEAWDAWARSEREPTERRTAVVPIWRRPWMVLGSGTFAGDLLEHLGIGNAFAGAADRYPKVTVEDMRGSGADLVVLPDEPYAFSGVDGPEVFPGMRVALVSGRHLEWYGPSLIEAPTVLRQQLAAAR